MEKTLNKMPDYAENFFIRLNNYLDKNVHFYGSVQRDDYLPNDSDIDVAIFTDNVPSMLNKLSNFLKLKTCDFKRFIWKLNYTDKIISGYKCKYEEPNNNFMTEFCIYNEKDKNELLHEYKLKTYLPFYSIWFLHIIKFLYYKLHLINREWYAYLKEIIINKITGQGSSQFVIMDLPK
jgi:predicted nucleotidyltransferase